MCPALAAKLPDVHGSEISLPFSPFTQGKIPRLLNKEGKNPVHPGVLDCQMDDEALILAHRMLTQQLMSFSPRLRALPSCRLLIRTASSTILERE